ncbi:hypothetical protein GCM10027589_46450 [Actinocorallia lasiicapitis]
MEEFWEVIGTNLLRDEAGLKTALAGVSRRLEGLYPYELIDFSRRLSEVLYLIDRRDFASIPVDLGGGRIYEQTSDHFLYARCACVLSGMVEYEEVALSGAGFDRYVHPFAQTAESLLYLAPAAYEQKIGGGLRLPVPPFPIESGSNPEGWAS